MTFLRVCHGEGAGPQLHREHTLVMKISTLHTSVAQDEEGAPVPINDPLGEPYYAADGTTPVSFTVVGLQSKAARTERERQTRRFIRAAGEQSDPASIKANRVGMAVACTIGWTGLEDEADQPIPLSPANVRLVLEADDRVLEQVEAGIRKHASFLASSKKS